MSIIILYTLFHPCTFYTGILYLVNVLNFDLYSPGLHYLCSAYGSLVLTSSLRGEYVKQLTELLKLQKKRRRDWASAKHMTECDVLSFLHKRTWADYTTMSLLLSYPRVVACPVSVVKKAKHVTLCHILCACSVLSPFLLQFHQLDELFHAFSTSRVDLGEGGNWWPIPPPPFPQIMNFECLHI